MTMLFVTSVTNATSVTPMICVTLRHNDTIAQKKCKKCKKNAKMQKYANWEMKYVEHIVTLCDTLTIL
jgi:hypothetical protein